MGFKVTKISGCSTSSVTGEIRAGMATFSDGKEWRFIRSALSGKVLFFIDHGLPSQHAVINHTRIVEYPKRVAALVKYMTDNGHWKKEEVL